MAWEVKDIEWIFSGIGVLAISAAYYLIRRKPKDSDQLPTIVVTQNNNPSPTASTNASEPPLPKAKPGVGILFIDDDTKFKVVSILKSHGWTNTKIVKDVTSLEQPEVVSADIFFVDIQGVGKALGFKDEGLGLVEALKKRYPKKKVVIYSAESGLNAFHRGFKVADDRISKDADPYEFIEAVERLSI